MIMYLLMVTQVLLQKAPLPDPHTIKDKLSFRPCPPLVRFEGPLAGVEFLIISQKVQEEWSAQISSHGCDSSLPAFQVYERAHCLALTFLNLFRCRKSEVQLGSPLQLRWGGSVRVVLMVLSGGTRHILSIHPHFIQCF